MDHKEIFALYLPQYHEIEENNEWWGKGYTEWNAVRSAKSLYKGHIQPKIPLNKRYYDLSDESGETWKWQAELAQQYGVDGFAIYHYWFKNGKKLLEKPMEILLSHPEINIQYFVCWANEAWKRTWYQSDGNQVLMPQEYGTKEEWISHYYYLRSFFFDTRYKKINNKPVVGIYNSLAIEKLDEMKETWEKLAIDDGFNGIYILAAKTAYPQEKRIDLVDGEYLFEPAYSLRYQYSFLQNIKRAFKRLVSRCANKILHIDMIQNQEDMRDLYKALHIPNNYVGKDIYYGICPSWDNTPRKQFGGCVFRHSTPRLFEQKLTEILRSPKAQSLVIINAWNEWGEGAYLEPDEHYRYAYLEAIKNAISKASLAE